MTDTQKLARTSFMLGKTFENVSNWDKAAEHYARAAELDPCFYTLICAQIFAHKINNHISALYFATRAKEAAIAEDGEGSLKHAESLRALGNVYQGNKEDEKAESFYQQELKIYKDKLEKNHPSIAICHANLSTIYFFRTHYGKAEKGIIKALKIQEKALEKNHPDIAELLDMLGAIYTRRKKYDEAEQSLERSLEIYKHNLMEMHETAIIVYKAFIELYERQERYKEAERYCKKIILISKKCFGKEGQITARSRYRLSHIYGRQMQYKKAKIFAEAALSVLEPLLGIKHPDVAWMRLFYDRYVSVLTAIDAKNKKANDENDEPQ